jgi:hypothetical protein
LGSPLEAGAQEGDRESFSVQSCTRVGCVTFGSKESRALDRSLVMKHQLGISCFARIQIGAKPISQRFPVEAQAKFAYRLHVLRIAPDPHLCRDKTDVIRPLTFQGGGMMQICSGLTSAAYLREHDGESVLRTRQIVPGTAWVVEMLQVTNRYVPRRFEVCCGPPSYRAENETQICPIPQKPASVVLLLRLSPMAFSYYGSRFVQAILCSF